MDINRVTITGNLTRDPELRTVGQNGTSVCELRIASNSREKQGGQWVDKPNYFDVTVWGAQGENCANFLEKGRGVGIDGELRWREWVTDDGGKRQAVSITAEKVKFLGSGPNGGNANGGQGAYSPPASPPAQQTGQAPAATGQAANGVAAPIQNQPAQEPAAFGAGAQVNGQEAGGGDDDLPF